MLIKIFLKYFWLCCVLGKNGIGSAVQRGYVYIWNCNLIVQKAYSSSTQLTRLKIQINTQITKLPKISPPNLSLQKSLKNHSALLFDKLPYPSHFQTNKNNFKKHLPQSQKSISTPHFQTNYRTLYTHFTISNNKLPYPRKQLSNLITEPNVSISKITFQYYISIQNQLKDIIHSLQITRQTLQKPTQNLNRSNTDKIYAFSEYYKNQSKVSKIKPIFNISEVSRIKQTS